MQRYYNNSYLPNYLCTFLLIFSVLELWVGRADVCGVVIVSRRGRLA